jgi:stearoyl-CoA desaturase (delta-9 desaturase)
MMLLGHLLAALAPFMYGRLELVAFAATTYVTLQFGLVLGYHRVLSHRSLATYPWLRRCLGLLGTLAVQTGPISWVANHRLHHQIADQELDPHTPTQGLVWAHLFWAFFDHPRLSDPEERNRFVPDLESDGFLRFCEEYFVFINVVVTAGVFLVGVGIGGISRGTSFVVWVVGLRTVCLWHITFLTNSVGHKFGYRNFETPDDSRNVWFLGVLALGDGWHNNHHAFPACAAHGRRWFEFDVTYRLVRMLERGGLVWSVKHPKAVPPTESSIWRRGVCNHGPHGNTIRATEKAGDHHLQSTRGAELYRTHCTPRAN